MCDDPLVLRPGEYTRGRVTPYRPNKPVMLYDDSRVLHDDELVVLPVRSWQSALRQLADTLAPGANIEIDPADPETSCARIAEAVGRRIAGLESQLDHPWKYE